MVNRLLVGLLGLIAALALAATAGAAGLPPVTATLETPSIFDDDAGGNGDADDPAIWLNPLGRAHSLVLGTKKNAGLDVYDLTGRTLQSIVPAPAPPGAESPGRFNNVDLIEGLRIGRRTADVAVVSDRGRDRIRIYAIDPRAAVNGKPPLTDITAPDAPRVFSATEAEVDEQATAYGLAATKLTPNGPGYVAATRRHRTEVALLRLVPRRDGTVTYAEADRLTLPDTFPLPGGGTWSPCEEPGEGAQAEGSVFDPVTRTLFVAQEDIGVWRTRVTPGGFVGRPALVDRDREFGVPATFDPATEECVPSGPDPGVGGTHLSADAEGLTIAPGPFGLGGVLIASSQGDSTFALYGNRGYGGYVGGFEVVDGLATDGVQHSDGADVVTAPVGPAFPHGLFVTHDGENTPDVLDPEGEVRANTDFKFVRWEAVLGAAF